nr:putative reverse transcriptase domain-containing protein [Tanacetum cinerariifolium]
MRIDRGRAGSGGGRTRGCSDNQGDGRIDGQGVQVGGQAQVGDQGRGQGNGRNQNGDAINDNIRGDVSRGCTYKEFLYCNPKAYDGKGGAIVYTCWIEKIELVQDMSRCKDSQKVKYIAGSFVGKAYMVEFSNPHTRSRSHCRFHELSRLVPHLVTPEGKRIERGNGGEPSKDTNVRDDNKRTRTGNAFATTVNPVRGGYTGTDPKCTTCSYHRSPKTPCRSCFNCNRIGHFAKDCRVAPRNVIPINLRNLVARTCYECGCTDHIKSTCPSKGGSSGPEHHDSGSFDVIIGMDWLSDHKAEIIYHEKVVRIPLLDGKVLRVLGENPEEEMRQLMSVKANEKKQVEIVVVKDFPEVFSDDLSGFPPIWEIEFQIELIFRATLVAKYPYRLAPSELEELSGQLKELKDKDPSKIEAVKNWKAPRTSSEDNAFQTLKDKLCNEPVLALPDRPKDFVVYCDASGLGLGCVLMQRDKRRWIALFSDYDCKICYHPGKETVVADALSRKERVNPKRDRAMNMTFQLSIKDRILAAQKEASDESARLQKVLDEMIELRNDEALYYLDQIWVHLKGDVRTLIIDEAHKSKYSIYLGADTMYYDLRDRYWWTGMKKDITVYMTIDFVTKFPRTSSGHDMIWVIVDRLTKSSHFLPMREDYKMERLARLYLNEIVTRHGVTISIISDHDSRFTSRLNFTEEPAEILERQFKKLKRSKIAIFNVGWNSKCGPEFTWEREDHMKLKYPHLFSADSS